MFKPSARALLGFLLASHLVLGAVFLTVIPPFEKLDERSHWYYVDYVRTHWNIPNQLVVRPERLQWYQPPLYYFAAAVLTSSIPSTNYLEPEVNDFYLRFPLTNIPDNANLFFHDPRIERWPWRGDILAIHLARALSLICSVIGIYFGFQTARLLFKDDWWALGAAAWLALTPGTLNYATTLANDAMAFATGSAMLYVMCRGLVQGFTWQRATFLGLLAGLAILSKLFVLATVALIPLAFVLAPDWQAGRRLALLKLAWLVALVTLVAGWWLANNWLLYGDFTGTRVAAEQYGIAGRPPITWQDIENQLFVWFFRYWAHFGAVGLPRWGNYSLIGMAVLLIVGIGLFFRRRLLIPVISHRRLFWFLSIAFAANLIQLLVPFFGVLHGSQPRYLLTVYAVAAIAQQLGVIGWTQLRPRLAATIPVVLMSSLAVYSAFAVLWPAYRYPLRVTDPAHLSSRYDTPANIPIGDTIRLIGFRIEPRAVRPGEMAYVTLCFESKGATETPYPYFVHIIDPASNTKVGERETHPGLGSYPTHFWEPGISFCDRVRIPVASSSEAQAPRSYMVITGFFDLETKEPLMAMVSGKADPFIAVGQIAVIPHQWPEAPDGEPLAVFGDAIVLKSAQVDEAIISPGQPVTIDFSWQLKQAVLTNYTLFVHMLDSNNQLLSQSDSEPRNGLFPTSFWPDGAVVSDSIILEVPAQTPTGEYRLVAGWYDRTSGIRVSATNAQGQPLPGDSVELAILTVR